MEQSENEIIISYDNFIGVYDNAFSDEFCDNLMAHHNWCEKNNRTYDRDCDPTMKKDKSTNLNPLNISEINHSKEHLAEYIHEFNNKFWDVCYKDYLETYSVLNDYTKHTINTYKIQKTVPGGGYHVWHAEDGHFDFSKRIGVYVLYLNDVEEGGETEFLYLSKRVKPKKGRLVIFPPNYPWAHRGNPPLKETKYIMTGWTEYS